MGREQDANWKLTSEFISQQSWAERVILISRERSKVVFKKEHQVVFEYVFHVNGASLPKMTLYAGM